MTRRTSNGASRRRDLHAGERGRDGGRRAARDGAHDDDGRRDADHEQRQGRTTIATSVTSIGLDIVGDALRALRAVDVGEDQRFQLRGPGLRRPFLAELGHTLATLDTLARLHPVDDEQHAAGEQQPDASRATRVLSALALYLREDGD